MKSGWIAIAGRPNAGKSSLLNAMLGSPLSAVTPKAQTTRDQIFGIYNDEKKGQIVFVDTPGIHNAKPGGINEFMVGQAREALTEPNLVWYLVDPRSALKPETAVLDLLPKEVPIFLIFTKSDLGWPAVQSKAQFESLLVTAAHERGLQFAQTFSISSLIEKGTRELLSASWPKMPEGPLYFPQNDDLSNRPLRFFVSELIRKQIFLKLGEEVPYSCGVEIASFDESATPPRIEATIFVERDSQKGIVVGKGGAKIKEIGQAAREEIEALIGGHAFLGLHVKVLREWTKDQQALKRLGYES
ncbi:MAG: GTPase Era [Bacteriovoracia bacterium]